MSAEALRAALRDAVSPAPDLPETRALFALRDHVLAQIAAVSGERRVLAVKGAALAYDVYPTPWQRPMNDIDLLVLPQDRQPLLDALARSGFQLTPPPRDRARSHALLGEDELTWAHGDARIGVEIHLSLDKVTPRPVDLDAIMRRARPHPGHAALLVPDDEDHLLLVVQHAAASDYAHELAWPDLELLFQRRPRFDVLLERARAWSLVTPLWVACETLRALGSTQVSDETLATLRPTAARRALVMRYYRVGDYPVPTRTDLGWPWIFRQTSQRDDALGWSRGVLRYALARALESVT